MKKVLAFIWKYIKIFFKAAGKFCKYVYASNIVNLFLSILVGLFISEFLGIVFIILTIFLWINDATTTPPEAPAV